VSAGRDFGIISPVRDEAENLPRLAGCLASQTLLPSVWVIVDNGSTDPAVLELYREIERDGAGRVVPFDRPFNYSAACNAGAAAATGDYLLFLNNDIEIIEPGWLDELVRWAQRPDVGIVGGKLLYPDRLIQHAGVAFGIGLVGHIFARAPEGADGVFGSTETYRNYLAVTGACQMMRREVFERLGGYDERYRLTFSDVVLCMEAWKAGYRVVYTPFARLVHHESYTRQRDESAEDMVLLARHLRGTGFTGDPYFHPHLDPKSPIPVVRPPVEASPEQVIADYVDRVLATVPAA
jgi:GT2 family glycosyltransferase